MAIVKLGPRRADAFFAAFWAGWTPAAPKPGTDPVKADANSHNPHKITSRARDASKKYRGNGYTLTAAAPASAVASASPTAPLIPI